MFLSKKNRKICNKEGKGHINWMLWDAWHQTLTQEKKKLTLKGPLENYSKAFFLFL